MKTIRTRTGTMKSLMALLLFLILPCLAARPALAQRDNTPRDAYPEDEVFVGGSYLHTSSGKNGYGAGGSLTEYPYEKHNWVGALVEAGTVHQTAKIPALALVIHEQLSTFMAGPSLVLRLRPSINPFVHATLGATIVNIHTTGSDTTIYLPSTNSEFTYAVGGGLDWPITHRFALRGQADYLHVSNTGDTNTIRGTIGTVFKF